MSDDAPFLILKQTCDVAMEWVVRHLRSAGMQVVRTFNLRDARQACASCPCPRHGTEQCDCQMVVLLVYGGESQPISIVAHGHNNQTWLSLVDTPQQRANPRLEAAVHLALVPHMAASLLDQARPPHAA